MKRSISNIIMAIFALAALGKAQDVPESPAQGASPAKQQKYSFAQAATVLAPRRLTYQGVLTGSSGAPVADGSYTVTIRLFDVSSGGAAAWSDNFTLPVVRGAFTAILGSGASLNVAFDRTYYLEVTVTGGPAGPSYPETLAPRTELTGAPYALAPWVPNGNDIHFDGGSVGLGTSTPGANGIPALKIEIADEDGLKSDFAMRVAGQGSGDGSALINFAKSRGSLATPAAAQHLDYMGGIQFLGYDGNAYTPAAHIGSQVLGTPGPGSIGGRIQFSTRKAGDPLLYVRMTIDSGGRVGIGKTHPSYLLDVNGPVNATDVLKNGSPLNLSQWTSYGGNIYYNDGSIGVGTNTPHGTLHLNSSYPSIIFSDTASGPDSKHYSFLAHGGNFYAGFASDDFNSGNTWLQAVRSGADVAMVNFPHGYVGMGTISPNTNLDVRGSGVNNYIKIQSSASNQDAGFQSSDGTYEVRSGLFGYSSGVTNGSWGVLAGALRMVVQQDGRVGIGANGALGKLTVFNPTAHTVSVVDSTTTAGITVAGDDLPIRLQLGVGGPEIGPYGGWLQASIDNSGGGSKAPGPMVLNPSGGNVGIGTTSPAYRLDVADDINVASGKGYRIGGIAVMSAPGGHTLVGRDAGASMTSATNNTATGNQALYMTTSGSGNTATGFLAMYKNTIGGGNTAIGSQALQENDDGAWNTASGHRAMMNNTSGSYNAAAGTNALISNKTGSFNAAFGADVLLLNTSGSANTALGYGSLSKNDSGSSNTATGHSALGANTNGSSNTANGVHALVYNATGNGNTANGWYAMESNTSGSYNTVSGYYALHSNISGTLLTAIGNDADVSVDGLTNASAIGNGAVVGVSNTMVFGNGAVSAWGFGANAGSGHAVEVGTNSSNGNGAYLTTGGTWTNASDRNKKENFLPVDGAEMLEKINSLPITMWNYKGEGKTIRHIGPMAQDFSRIFGLGNDDKSISTIDPAGIALAAIKELNAELGQLRAELSLLGEENVRLRKANGLMIEAQSSTSERITHLETALRKLGLQTETLVKVSQKDLK